jgi:hypothetical protein
VVSHFVLTGPNVSTQLGNVFDLGGAQLGAVSGRRTAHEFCLTDLVTGLPITFSTVGAVARRCGEGGAPAVAAMPKWRLANIVRASAAFPGIPPKLVRFRGDRPPGFGPIGFGADGGIWNNLGTQALNDSPRAAALPVLCINASAHAKAVRSWPYFVPGVAMAAALARTMTVLNRNTVEPRVEAIDAGVARWSVEQQTWSRPPPAVVADLRSITCSVERVAALGVDVGLECLSGQPWWQTLVALDDDRQVRTPTTLNRIPRRDAAILVRRGYANAWLASLALQPLTDHEPAPWQTDVARRLAHIGAGASPPEHLDQEPAESRL